MAIETTINLIQAVNRGITGMRYAPSFSQYPLTADSVRLPMALTWPGPATWRREQFGSKKRVDRVYDVLVFCEALGQNTLPGRSALAVALLQTSYATWIAVDANGYPTALAQPVNDGDPQVTLEWDGTYPQDTGLRADLQVGGVVYAGFTLQLRVRELT